MKKLFYCLIICLVQSYIGHTQVISGNCYIKGQYVEVGINQCGGWGTTNNAPAGYHPRSGTQLLNPGDNQFNLGFVADPDRNGWTFGAPHYYGDYFMPVAPYVGWGISFNGLTFGSERTGTSSSACAQLFSGSIIMPQVGATVINTPQYMQATWQGFASNMLVKKIVTVKPLELYFTVRIVLRNTSLTPINNIYYGEYVNPDNDAYINDVFSNNLFTTNTIASQTPTGPAQVVALGAATNSYISLGSRDCRAKVFRSTPNYVPLGSPIDWYLNTPAASIAQTGFDFAPNNNLSIGIAFNVGNIAPGDSTSFLYTYILKSTDFLPALTETDPNFRINGLDYPSGDTIRPCANTILPMSVLNGDYNTWTWSPNTGLNTVNGVNVIAAVGTTPITYTATGVGPCGIKTIKITIDPWPKPALGPDQTDSICPGTKANLWTVFDTTGLSSVWTRNGFVVANPAAVDTGTYRLIGTNPGGCKDTAFVVVRYFNKPQLGIDQAGLICPGNSYDLSTAFLTTGLTSNWTLAGIAVANPTAVTIPGTYELIATSINGCSDTAVLILGVGTKPNLGADINLQTCPGTNIDLTTQYNTAGLSSDWTSGGIPVPNPSSVADGIYQIIVTNGDGCTDTAMVTVGLYPKPPLGADKAVGICPGSFENLTLEYNTTGLSSFWTIGGIAVANPNAVDIGIYQLIAINSNGCADTAIVTVSYNPKPNLGADKTKGICPATTEDLTTEYITTGLISNWTIGGVPVPNPSAVGIGVYQLIASNGSGCADTAIITVNQNPAPSLGADKNIQTCPGTNVDLTTQFITTGFTTNWTSAGVPVPNPASVGAGLYQLIAINAFGCADTALVNVSLFPKPTLGADISKNICLGSFEDLTLEFTTTGLTSNWTSAGIPVPNPTAVIAGIYQLIATNANGCSDTAIVTIGNFPKPNLGADINLSVCPGNTVNLTTQFNTTGLTSNWTSAGVPVANPLAVSAGIYQLIVSNSNSCADTAFVLVSLYPKPNLGADKNISTCPGTTVNLTTLFATGVWTTTWDSPTPTAVGAGYYTLIVTNSNGCTDTAHVTVALYPKPNLGPDQTVSICPNETIDLNTLFNTSGLLVSWSIANPQSAGTGFYTIIATNSNGCMDTANVTVLLYPAINPTIALSPTTTTIIEGTAIRFFAGGTNIVSYLWDPGVSLSTVYGASVVATPATTTRYKLTVKNNGGCEDSAFVTLTVIPLEIEPSAAFTPNGDGYTDKWVVRNIQLSKTNKVIIYNRWGNKVFEANNYQNNWDGTFKGNPLPDGAYYYQIEATTIGKRTIHKAGSITLLR